MLGMKKNVGGADRLLRIIIGSLMLLAFLSLPAGPAKWLMLIGIVPLATGIIGSCGLYQVFGINTCPLEKK